MPERRHRASLGELGRMVGHRPFGYFWDGPTLGVCQKYLAVRAKPFFQLKASNGYVLVAFNWPRYISIRCIKTFYGLRPYGVSLCKSRVSDHDKVTKTLPPPRTALASLRCPSLRSRSVGTLRRAILGPIAALPASMPVDPLRETSTRPPEGAADQDQKPDHKQITSRSKTRWRYPVAPHQSLHPLYSPSLQNIT